MRLKCLGILNYYDHASKVAQEKYLKSLLPVPAVLYSAAEWFGFDGSETFEKVCRPLEILEADMETVPDLGDMAMEVFIICPVEFAGFLMSQVLPQEIPLISIPDSISILELCARFEDDLAGNEVETRLSKHELHISAGDMLESPEIRLYLDILETVTNVQNFDSMQEHSSTALKIQVDIEPDRIPCPFLDGEEFSIRKAVQMLEAASDKNQPNVLHEVVPAFELKLFHSVTDEEPHGGVRLYDEIENLATSVIREDTRQGNEDLGDPACRPDFDYSAFILNSNAPDLTLGSQCRLRGLSSFTCHTLLEDVSGPQISVSTCELPEMIEEPEFFTSFSGEILDTAVSPVVLENLGSFSTFQNFEALIVMPELTVDHSLFRSLPVNFFSQDGEAHIAEDVLRAHSLTRSSSPTSASDLLYLDWHLSQKGSCNNHACFRLQHRLKEEQLRLPGPPLPEKKKNSDVHLLLLLAENAPRMLKTQKADCEDYAEELDVPIVAPKGPLSKPALQNFRCRGLKTVENDPNHSVLMTEGQVDSSMIPRLSSSKPDETSIADVLSLVQQARRGCIRESLSKKNLKGGEACTVSSRLMSPTSESKFILPSAHENLQPTPPRANPPVSFEEPTNWRGQGPRTILIVNVLQPEGPVLWERRSAFQNILRLEDQDLQVVEREFQLPVDLILSPSTCLVIYTQEKLKLRASDFNNPNSEAVLSCITQTIIDCHLKSFSSCFQRCFMVFEGEPAFTTAILHNMQKLYGAAAGFGMQLFQCFMSGDCTFTDVLITQRIEATRKLVKRPYAFPMTESLSDGEAFLAQFSSLNPLAAHAILCLGVTPATFISWSHEKQVSSLDGYDIPNHILKLFKSQCQNENLERPLDPGYVVGVPERPCFPYFPPASEIERHFNQWEVTPPDIPYFPPAAAVVSELEAHWQYETPEEKDRLRTYPPIHDNSCDINQSFDNFLRDQRTIASEEPYCTRALSPPKSHAFAVPNWTLTRPVAAHRQMHSKHTESWSEPSQVSIRKPGQTNLSALQQLRRQSKRPPVAPRSQQKSKRGHYAVM